MMTDIILLALGIGCAVGLAMLGFLLGPGI